MIRGLRTIVTSSSFLRGAAGATVVIACVLFLLGLWHLVQDHLMFHQGMNVLSQIITAHPELLHAPK